MPDPSEHISLLHRLLRQVPAPALRRVLERQLGPGWRIEDPAGACLLRSAQAAAGGRPLVPLVLDGERLGSLAVGPDALAHGALGADWIELLLMACETGLLTELSKAMTEAEYRALLERHVALCQAEEAARMQVAVLRDEVARQRALLNARPAAPAGPAAAPAGATGPALP